MKLYHYTSHRLLIKILQEGLIVNSRKNTIDGLQLGIYVTSDHSMNFFETLPDTKFDKTKDIIVRLELSSDMFKLAKLDKEFHQFDDIDEELETFEHIMMYIDKNISSKNIVDIQYMNESNTRNYSLFGEI